MAISAAQYEIALYIHPDKGPITPMLLNLLEIETAVTGLDAHSNRDEARIQAIAYQIKTKFPNVDPYSKLRELTQLISRFSHVAIFNGIVLRLPGTIDGPSPIVPNMPEEEKQRLIDEVNKKRAEVEAYRQEKVKLEVTIANIQTRNTQLEQVQQTHRDEMKRLQVALDKAEREAYSANTEMQKNKGKVSALEQEKAGLEVQLEQLKKDRRSINALKEEVAALQENLTSQRSVEQQLRDTLKQREQEMNVLRTRLRRLAEGELPGKPTQGSDPWLDL